MAKTYHIDGVAYPKGEANIGLFQEAVIEEIGAVLGRFGIDIHKRDVLDAVGLKAVLGQADASVYDEDNILLDSGECPFGLRYTSGEWAGLSVKALDYGFDIVVPSVDLSDVEDSVVIAHDDFIIALLKSVCREFADRFCICLVSDDGDNFVSDDF